MSRFVATVLLIMMAADSAAAQECRKTCLPDETTDATTGCCVFGGNELLVPDGTVTACVAGQVPVQDSPYCCWPGQVWGGDRCRGIPKSCPAQYTVDPVKETCTLKACVGGQVRASDQATCCWPGQVAAAGQCRGRPTSCPRHWEIAGETCSADAYNGRLAACTGTGKDLLDDGRTCCWPGQTGGNGACQGTPSRCPVNHDLVGNGCSNERFLREQASQKAAAERAQACRDQGRELHATGLCCFPGQAVTGGKCTGRATGCAAPWVLHQGGCVTAQQAQGFAYAAAQAEAQRVDAAAARDRQLAEDAEERDRQRSRWGSYDLALTLTPISGYTAADHAASPFADPAQGALFAVHIHAFRLLHLSRGKQFRPRLSLEVGVAGGYELGFGMGTVSSFRGRAEARLRLARLAPLVYTDWERTSVSIPSDDLFGEPFTGSGSGRGWGAGVQLGEVADKRIRWFVSARWGRSLESGASGDRFEVEVGMGVLRALGFRIYARRVPMVGDIRDHYAIGLGAGTVSTL